MPDYAVGNREFRSAGAVFETYAETDALEVDCPNCHAKAGGFCRHELGHERKIPCLARIAAAVKALQPNGDPL